MRGVVSAGMLLGIEALGLRNSFDAAYGTSSGAANAAYFLSAQAGLGASIYYEYPKHYGSIVRFSRLLHGEPVVDVRSLFQEAIFDRFPLDFAELTRSGIHLTVLASRINQPGAEDSDAAPLCRLTGFRDRNELLRALHASAQLPIIGGGSVMYDGMSLLDGGIVEEVPVYAAISDKHSHILVLVTLPEGMQKHRLAQWIEKMYVLPRLKTVDAALARSLSTRHERYRATLNLLKAKRADQHGPPYVTFVALPPIGPRVNAFETRRSMLIQGAEAGIHAALRTFSSAPFVVHDLLTIVDMHGRYGYPRLTTSQYPKSSK